MSSDQLATPFGKMRRKTFRKIRKVCCRNTASMFQRYSVFSYRIRRLLGIFSASSYRFRLLRGELYGTSSTKPLFSAIKIKAFYETQFLRNLKGFRFGYKNRIPLGFRVVPFFFSVQNRITYLKENDFHL